MLTTARLQNVTRPVLDRIYPGLGQRVQVFRAQVRPADPGALPPPELDESGMPVTPPVVAPATGVVGPGTPLGEYPCVAFQLDARDKAELGADTALPLWEVYVHWSAPLHEPGLLLLVSGGELPGPLALAPVGDVVDEGTQRVAWVLTARATDGRSA